MKKHRVTFYPDNRIAEVAAGETVLDAAMAADVHITATCGGDGTCGKCRIIVDAGDIVTKQTPKISEEDAAKGYVLACLTSVESDLKILVPPETRLGIVPEEAEEGITYGRMMSAEEEAESLDDVRLDPPVAKVFVEMNPPSLDDNSSDLSRLSRALNRAGVEGRTIAEPPALAELAEVIRAGKWKTTATVRHGLCEALITAVEPGDTSASSLALAIDVGTTTVVSKLLDLNTKEAVAESSAYNRQISAGEDVISRIVFSQKKGGLARLQELVADTINETIKRLLAATGRKASDIAAVYTAGNTIMEHLLLGLNPKYLREEPYIPTATEFSWLPASSLGIDLGPHAYLHPLPCVASYLGADVVAGVVAAGIPTSDKLSLYIDVGTNGEMVLGNREFLASCSCSAGPAFEGGGVRFGMRATTGAIEEVRIDSSTYEPMIKTIGEGRPLGICGSGLIDTMAELFLAGVVDAKGKINVDLKTDRTRVGKQGPEYVLAKAAGDGAEQDIVITEGDLDNLMRAKAAVFAAIEILLDSVSVSLNDIDAFFIAGSFGKHLDAAKAVTIGLLPDLPEEKFVFIGNGSLWGAHMSAVSRAKQQEIMETAARMTYIDLSTNNKFMDGYVAALFLPHTNKGLFPSVASKMGG
ncbi:MAG: ASKHA domain-containing protein [Actinomycetota bacterium]